MNQLEQFLQQAASKYSPHAIIGRPETVRVYGELGEFNLVWHFTDHIPEGFPYINGSETFLFDDKEITCRFECVVADTLDYWLVREEPFFKIMEPSYMHDGKRWDFSALKDLQSEVAMEMGKLVSIIEGLEENDLVAMITVSSISTEMDRWAAELSDIIYDGSHEPNGSDVPETVQFSIVLNSPTHIDIKGINTAWRFEHVQAIEVSWGRVPVDIQTLSFDEFKIGPGSDNPSGQPIQIGEEFAELAGAERVDFGDEMARIDFQKLIDEDGQFPDPPRQWPDVQVM